MKKLSLLITILFFSSIAINASQKGFMEEVIDRFVEVCIFAGVDPSGSYLPCITQENSDYEIVDYVHDRDIKSIRAMYCDNWKLLGYYNRYEAYDLTSLKSEKTERYRKVLRVHNRTVGFIECDYFWSYKTGCIITLMIHNAYRNKGYASQLLQFYIHEMLKD